MAMTRAASLYKLLSTDKQLKAAKIKFPTRLSKGLEPPFIWIEFDSVDVEDRSIIYNVKFYSDSPTSICRLLV